MNIFDEIIDEQVEQLKKLCAINSKSKNVIGLKYICKYLSDIAKNEGFEYDIKDTENGPILIIRVNPDKEDKVILSAHMDTVFDNDLAVYQDNDYIYGASVSDCKGGIIVSLYSVIIAKRLGLLNNKQYTLIYNCDEEIGSKCSKDIFEEESKNAKAALVFEPARGDDGIITSRRSVCSATIEVFGKSAHSSEYEKGLNAVIGLSNIIQELNNYHDIERNIYINMGVIQTNSPINKVCDYASMKLSCRIANKDQYDEYINIFRKCANTISDKYKVNVNCDKFSLPMIRNDKNIELYNLAKLAGEQINISLNEIHALGAGDASKLSNFGIPTIDGLGPHTYCMHSDDEHTTINSIKERTRLSVNILKLLDIKE